MFQEREAEEEAGTLSENSPKKEAILTPLQEWEKSLMTTTSHAQLFVHLTTLENSIIWSK